MNLKNRSFLKLLDFTPEEIDYLIDLAQDFKEKKKNNIPHRYCEGKNVALIFEKTSTRTRCSFEVAAADLGMHPVYLDPKSSQIGKKESIADTARVLGRMFDGIEYRGYGQQIVEDLQKYSGVPVWNGLTNEFHPTQILADFMTIKEHFGKLKGVKLVYMGDEVSAPSATVATADATLESATVTWSSSEESVATIDASTGAITLVGIGSTRITASYEGTETEYKPSEASYTLNVYGSYTTISDLQGIAWPNII